jgi:AP-3 complex subunit mu
MIQSMFILSPTGEVLIERHFRDAPVSRSVCDYFWDKASQGVNHHGGLSTTTSLLTNEEQQLLLPLDVLPVMEVPETNHGTVYIISILRDGLSYLAVVPAEVSPLMILEFLHRVADIFVDYFGSPADESAVKENFSTVYQLLEEMVDYGWPLTTEPNALKAMIRPPSIMSKISSAVFSNTNVSHELPSGTISNMPWRAAGVTYTQNEIYMDIVEEIDAIIDAASGNVVQSDVSGRIQCQCQLSGIPDLLLTFKNPKLIDDCSFHPCVRYGRYERDQVVSFVPPDGNFELMKYSISADRKSSFSPPLECHSQWNIFKPPKTSNVGSTNVEADYSARLMVTVRVKSLSSLITSASRNSKVRMMVEDVAVTIPFPKQLRTATFQVSSGSIVYDEAGKVAKWTLGKLADDPTLPRVQLIATLKMNPPKKRSKRDANDSEDEAEKEDIRSPNLSLHWKIPLTSVSGLTVSGLSITGESYQPYKGVRNITKSGLYQVRYS